MPRRGRRLGTIGPSHEVTGRGLARRAPRQAARGRRRVGDDEGAEEVEAQAPAGARAVGALRGPRGLQPGPPVGLRGHRGVGRVRRVALGGFLSLSIISPLSHLVVVLMLGLRHGTTLPQVVRSRPRRRVRTRTPLCARPKNARDRPKFRTRRLLFSRNHSYFRKGGAGATQREPRPGARPRRRAL